MSQLHGNIKVAFIELTDVTKGLNGKLLLASTSLSINEGDFFALVGAPSSGKSIILDILMNFISPSTGSAEIMGMSCQKQSYQIKKEIGYCAKEPDFCRNMRIADIVSMCAKMQRVKNSAYINELCTYFDLKTSMRISKASVSEKKKLGLITAMMRSPKLLLLDNPFFGLDRITKQRLEKKLSELHKNGTTILMTCESLSIADRLCTRMAQMHHGTMLEVAESDMLIKSQTRLVSIKTDDDITALLVLFKIDDVTSKKGYITFRFKNDINDLIRALTSYRIEDLQIALPEIEDVIYDYYNENIDYGYDDELEIVEENEAKAV